LEKQANGGTNSVSRNTAGNWLFAPAGTCHFDPYYGAGLVHLIPPGWKDWLLMTGH